MGHRYLLTRLKLNFLYVLFLLCASNPAYAQLSAVPAPTGFITDGANLITAADKARIRELANSLESKTTAQLAILTVETTQPEAISQYSMRVFDQWKIGQKGKDNGVLLVVAVKDREAWIATGYGLEGALPDITCSKIVREVMVPYFKNQQYSQGISAGATAIISLIAKESNVSITGQEGQIFKEIHNPSSHSWLAVFIGTFFSGEGSFWVFIIVLYLFISFINWIIQRLRGKTRKKFWDFIGGSGGGGSGGSGRSGGFSSGGGGFGGGSSGGGGGGGKW